MPPCAAKLLSRMPPREVARSLRQCHLRTTGRKPMSRSTAPRVPTRGRYCRSPSMRSRSRYATASFPERVTSQDRAGHVRTQRQREPHAPFPALPGRDVMRPSLPDDFDEVRLRVLTAMAQLTGPAENLRRIATFAEPYYRGEFSLALERIDALGLGA